MDKELLIAEITLKTNQISTTKEKLRLTETVARVFGVVYLGDCLGALITLYIDGEKRMNLHTIITLTVMSFMMLLVASCYLAALLRQSKVATDQEEWSCVRSLSEWKTAIDKHTIKECVYMLLITVTIALYQSCQLSSQVVIEALARNLFHWTHTNNNWYIISTLACSGLGLLLLIPLILRNIQLTSMVLPMVAIGANVISLALAGFAMESWMLYINVILNIVTSPFVACQLSNILKISSRETSYHFLIASLGSMIVLEFALPPAALELYFLSRNILEGMALFIIAGFLIVVFCVCLWLSIDFQTYEHQALLDDIQAGDEILEESELEAEDWLLDAFGQLNNGAARTSIGENVVVQTSTSNSTTTMITPC